jgi:hypothetical protein
VTAAAFFAYRAKRHQLLYDVGVVSIGRHGLGVKHGHGFSFKNDAIKFVFLNAPAHLFIERANGIRGGVQRHLLVMKSGQLSDADTCRRRDVPSQTRQLSKNNLKNCFLRLRPA